MDGKTNAPYFSRIFHLPYWQYHIIPSALLNAYQMDQSASYIWNKKHNMHSLRGKKTKHWSGNFVTFNIYSYVMDSLLKYCIFICSGLIFLRLCIYQIDSIYQFWWCNRLANYALVIYIYILDSPVNFHFAYKQFVCN